MCHGLRPHTRLCKPAHPSSNLVWHLQYVNPQTANSRQEDTDHTMQVCWSIPCITKDVVQTRCLINNYINYTGTAEWSMNKLNTLWIFTKDLFNIKLILTISDQIHKCHTRISFVSLQIVKTQTSLWTCAVLLQLSLYAEFLCLYMQCANSIESIQTMQMWMLVEPFAVVNVWSTIFAVVFSAIKA